MPVPLKGKAALQMRNIFVAKKMKAQAIRLQIRYKFLPSTMSKLPEEMDPASAKGFLHILVPF